MRWADYLEMVHTQRVKVGMRRGMCEKTPVLTAIFTTHTSITLRNLRGRVWWEAVCPADTCHDSIQVAFSHIARKNNETARIKWPVILSSCLSHPV